MFQEGPDFVAGKRAGEPLYVVFHEHLHGGTVDRARAPNRQVHATGNRHVRANENWMNRRFGDSASRRTGEGAVSPSRRFFISFLFTIGSSKRLGATPASSGSLCRRIPKVYTLV